MTGGRQYARLRPDELEALQRAAPVAYVPLGPLEFHGPHLPVGVDRFIAHALCTQTAAVAGGVVLPTSHIVCGCLDLPFTLDFAPELVEATVRATIDQLVSRGYRVVVVLTGHGPLDLIHLIKRVCRDAESGTPDLRAYGLCWLELNAHRGVAERAGEPAMVDHAALVETSWMQHLYPDLVEVARLDDDPEAAHVGVYGRNPRFTAHRDFGAGQVAQAVELLAHRVRDMLEGGRVDPLADLHRFVELAWPEPLELTGQGGDAATAMLRLHNPGRASRYVSECRLEIDGRALDPASVTLVNTSPGERGVPVPAAALGPESGFYIRRGQTATVRLGEPVADGVHRVAGRLGLGGVATQEIGEDMHFPT